jgi:acylphosphatase
MVQGSETAVDALVDWSRRGPPQARVDRVEIEPIETNERFSGFEKRTG